MPWRGDGVRVTNRNQQVVFCNLAARRLLNLRSPWQPGEPLAQMVEDPEFIQLVVEGMNLQGDQQVASRELLLQKPAPMVLMANCAPVRSEKGETLGAVTVLRDISELKELDKAKSRFVSMVAHELRAPLAAIEGYLDLILEGVTEIPPEKLREILERSRERTRGLLAMVNDLLTLSRMQFQRRSREIEKVDLPEVLQEVIELMRGSALEKKIILIGKISADLPKISGNREDLVRVFTNLVDNAIKYNRSGGSVTIQAQADENYVAVEIHDTGIGIPKNELPHIFDEFHRIKRKETRGIPGTGLGLSIAKKIVESYNGFIEVESQLNQGSKFRIFFPRG
jgi:two-component system phosphate regulon sensor histidine kinase PhoR